MPEHDPYKLFAAGYDFITKGFMRGPREAMLDMCSRHKVGRLLDIGCGTGDFAALARTKGFYAAGVDMSPAMLKQAAKKKKRDNTLPLVFGDGLYPPFKSDSFDALTYSLVLHETSSSPEEIVAKGFELAPLAVVLEWKIPERNLDYICSAWVPVIECLAGIEHFKNYRRFISRGGVYGLAERVNARVEESIVMKAGSVVLALLSRPNS